MRRSNAGRPIKGLREWRETVAGLALSIWAEPDELAFFEEWFYSIEAP